MLLPLISCIYCVPSNMKSSSLQVVINQTWNHYSRMIHQQQQYHHRRRNFGNTSKYASMYNIIATNRGCNVGADGWLTVCPRTTATSSIERMKRNYITSSKDMHHKSFESSSATAARYSTNSINSNENKNNNHNNNNNKNLNNSNKNNKRIVKALYKQLIRWCDTVEQSSKSVDSASITTPTAKNNEFPIGSLIVAPITLHVPEQIDQYHTDLLAYGGTYNKYEMDNTIITRTRHLLPQRSFVYRYKISFGIHTMKELKNSLQMIFRMNSIESSDDMMENNYTKQRIQEAFATLKTLNELYNAKIQPMFEKRMYSMDRTNVKYRIGQIVQHKTERWRGVISDWKRVQRKQYNINTINTTTGTDGPSDNFDNVAKNHVSALTTKLYSSTMDNDTNDLDEENNNNNNDDETNIQYTIIVDVGDIADEYHTNKIKFPSLIGNSSEYTVVSQNDIVPVQNEYLTRIRSSQIEQDFDGYDIEQQQFLPNPIKVYEYPNDCCYYDTINNHHQHVDSTTSNELHLSSSLSSTTSPRNNDYDRHYNNSSITASDLSYDIQDIINGVQELAEELEYPIVMELIDPPKINRMNLELLYNQIVSTKMNFDILDSLYKRLERLRTGNILPTKYQYMYHEPSSLTIAIYHLRELYNLSRELYDINKTRTKSIADKPYVKFHIGDIVQHTVYNFRGVIINWDKTPRIDVREWDGVQHIHDPMNKPFYQIIPDKNDCIEQFGTEKSLRYVCEDSLILCPFDKHSSLEIDIDPTWTYQESTGTYVAPIEIRYGYGDMIDEDNRTERITKQILSTLNRWQCYAQQYPHQLSERRRQHQEYTGESHDDDYDEEEDEDPIVAKLNMKRIMKLSSVCTNITDSLTIQEVIMLIRASHPNEEIREEFDNGIVQLLIHKNVHEAMQIFQTIVEKKDPYYVEAWNKLAICHYTLLSQADNPSKQQQQEMIMSSLQHVLEIDPLHNQVLYNLGLMYYENKQYDIARLTFERVLQVDPWLPLASTKLALCIDALDNQQQQQQQQQHQDQ